MIRKIIIVHVLHSVGGVDVSLRTILGSINENKFEHIVVHGYNDTNDDFVGISGKKVRAFKIDIQREIHFIKDLKSIWQLVKILKIVNPDLIHAHSAKGGAIARIATIFHKKTVLHTPQAYSYLSKPNGLKRILFLHLERMLKNLNSVLLASSNSERNRGLNELGYKATKTILFNNAIQPISLLGNNPFVKSLPDKFIATVGRPSYQKNIESMLHVLNICKNTIPDIKLVIMGVGHYSPNLDYVRKTIESLSLQENVILVEWQERQNILEAISASTLYVSTARYEGLPYAVIEAMALSKTLVLTNTDGNRDLVSDGQNGYLVDENSESLFAERVVKLYLNDFIRNAMGKKSKDIFEKNHNMNIQIRKLEDIYVDFVSKS